MKRSTDRRVKEAATLILILSAITCGRATIAAAPAAPHSITTPSAAKNPHNNSNRLVIHEWGTFTSLQNEKAEAIGGINSDDEPVPEFVHRIAQFLLLGPRANVPALYQGAPHCHPDVTMRLETPV